MMDTFRDNFKYNARDAEGTQSPSEALRPKSSKEEKIKRPAEWYVAMRRATGLPAARDTAWMPRAHPRAAASPAGAGRLSGR